MNLIPSVDNSRVIDGIIDISRYVGKGIKGRFYDVCSFLENMEKPMIVFKVINAVIYPLSLISKFTFLVAIQRPLEWVIGLVDYFTINFTTVKDLLAQNLPWHRVAFDILKLAIGFFLTLDYVQMLKDSATVIHKLFSKIPVMGVLNFAGVFDLLIIGMYSYETFDRACALVQCHKNHLKVRNRLNFWKDITEKKIQEKITAASGNNEKVEKWTKIRQLFHDNQASFAKLKEQKIDRNREKNCRFKWEKTAKAIGVVQKVILIAGTALTASLVVSGVGIVAIPFIKIGTMAVDSIPDAVNYFIDHRVTQIVIPEAKMPEVHGPPS